MLQPPSRRAACAEPVALAQPAAAAAAATAAAAAAAAAAPLLACRDLARRVALFHSAETHARSWRVAGARGVARTADDPERCGVVLGGDLATLEQLAFFLGGVALLPGAAASPTRGTS